MVNMPFFANLCPVSSALKNGKLPRIFLDYKPPPSCCISASVSFSPSEQPEGSYSSHRLLQN